MCSLIRNDPSATASAGESGEPDDAQERDARRAHRVDLVVGGEASEAEQRAEQARERERERRGLRHAEHEEAQHEKDRRALVDQVVRGEHEDVREPEQEERAPARTRTGRRPRVGCTRRGSAAVADPRRTGRGRTPATRRPERRPSGYREAGDDAIDVRARLGERRDAVRRVDRTGPGVVRGDREPDVALVPAQQVVEVARPAVDVLVRVEGVRDAVHRRGSGHQLHQSLGADARDRARVPVRLRVDHRCNELRVHRVRLRVRPHDRSRADRAASCAARSAKSRRRCSLKGRRMRWQRQTTGRGGTRQPSRSPGAPGRPCPACRSHRGSYRICTFRNLYRASVAGRSSRLSGKILEASMIRGAAQADSGASWQPWCIGWRAFSRHRDRASTREPRFSQNV